MSILVAYDPPVRPGHRESKLLLLIVPGEIFSVGTGKY